jgi:hypothetical protein
VLQNAPIANFAKAASEKGFATFKLSSHKNYNMSKTLYLFITFIFDHRKVLKIFLLYDAFAELHTLRSVMQPLQNPPLGSSTDL